MSEYFRVLRRLELEWPTLREPASSAETPACSQTAPRARARSTDPAAANLPVHLPATFADPAYVTLYDNIRATANGRATRSLVFAGATAGNAVRAVVQGLAAHVQRLNQRVLMAELVADHGPPLLRTRTDGTDVPLGGTESLSLDLRSHACTDAVRAWLAGNSEADLVLIEADPLARSLDAAMLACGCDGLIIVAAAGVTSRKDLQVAAERARAVDCRPLGLVVHGHAQRTPSWLRRIPGQHGR
jgi:Mrp family chromosome partitioning ATPase